MSLAALSHQSRIPTSQCVLRAVPRGFASSAPVDALAEVVALCKRRGFVFPTADLYHSGGIGYDYGPMGAQLLHNLQSRWWRDFVTTRRDVVPLDSCTLAPAAVWDASGHLQQFVDPLTECASCHRRFRADHLVDVPEGEGGLAAVQAALESGDRICPSCGASGQEGLTDARVFNMLFKTHVGPVQEGGAEAYLRPETAQGVYTQWRNIATTTRNRLPLGVATLGRSFRNEISTGNFTFRTREFSQAEIQYFTHPDSSAAVHQEWVDRAWQWLLDLGLPPHKLRRVHHSPSQLAHYSLATTDIEYLFPFGWGEVWGVSNRGSFDLEQHSSASGADLRAADPGNMKHKFWPHVVEPALGVNRLLLAILCSALEHETTLGGGGEAHPPSAAPILQPALGRAVTVEADGSPRPLMRLPPVLAPSAAVVLPLVKKQGLPARAEELADALSTTHAIAVDVDVPGSIGRRYRRADEAGTPLCITLDFTTLQDDTVTVRWRDTMQQWRVPGQALLDASWTKDDWITTLLQQGTPVDEPDR